MAKGIRHGIIGYQMTRRPNTSICGTSTSWALQIFSWSLARILALLLLGLVSPIEGQTYTYIDGDYPAKAVPATLLDPRTGIHYSLESDGRHISAASPQGRRLWRVDPFVDGKLTSYRLPHPVIVGFVFVKGDWWHIHAHFGPADDFISIQFNSSQAGIIRKADGKFIFLGQD
jgi:hypothetical protein